MTQAQEQPSQTADPPYRNPFHGLYLALCISGLSFTIGVASSHNSLLRWGSVGVGGVGLVTAAIVARRPMEQYEEEYGKLLTAWNDQVSALETQYTDELQAAQKKFDDEIADLRKTHAQAIEEQKANLFAVQRDQERLIQQGISRGLEASQKELDQLKQSQAEEIKKIKSLAEKQFQQSQADKIAELKARKHKIHTQYCSSIQALKNKYESKLQGLRDQHSTTVLQLRQHLSNELATAQSTINAQASQIKGLLELVSDHEQALNQLEQKSKMAVLELRHENRLLRSTSAAAQSAAIAALNTPRQFAGSTPIDEAGNRIIEHFLKAGIVLDAVECVKIPGGFRLRYKLDRNSGQTQLTQDTFDKQSASLGLWGLSQRPLEFELDPRNFLVSVSLYSASDLVAESTTSRAPADIASRFSELNCFPAAEFETVIRSKFVPRVRVVAGSTGGKSPLMELIACAIARINGGQLWLLNPIPGSPKDWFSVPGVIPPGVNGIEAAIAWLQKAHKEFQDRRNDLPGTAGKDFITVMVDEINSIARDYADLGTVMKDFYQLSDHTKMGFLTAGQGGNVSGVSGGSKANAKTGNAGKLMEEDFDNATQVFTAAAARTWLDKKYPGSQKKELLEALTALNKLCDELNTAEGKSAYPADIAVKKVDPDAYRIALVVSPRTSEPFFIQIPPYSSYAGKMDGVKFPPGSLITAPIENQEALSLIDTEVPDEACRHCGCTSFYKKGTYKDKARLGQPRYVCAQCRRAVAVDD
ncbi:hypothetical protein NDI45_25225 [Leptolyngbya sp. GB1-A1]|uniref:hypothetical protein n=1 Tax=Leptolyngbya sp. GB1-A1 TaxID=2933908 RepID=UPI00329A038C